MFTVFYWLYILGGIVLTLSLNLVFHFSFQTVLDFFVIFVLILCPSIISLLFEKILPSSFFDGHFQFYKPKKYEKSLYKKLRVKDWKDYVPNLGNVGKDIAGSDQQPTVELFEKFLHQTCLGEVVHKFCVVSSIVSSVIILFVRADLFLRMALPICFVYVTINMLSIIIQRYNRPRIYVMLERLKRTQQQPIVSEEESKKQVA